MVYEWKSASRIRANPEAAAEQFAALNQSVGLTPQTLLEANRPADAPLHNEYEWDDTAAAEKYRLQQSGHLIRSLVIIPEADPNEDDVETTIIPIRAYFPIQDAYEPIAAIIQSPDKRDVLLRQAKQELNAYLQKYHNLSELQPVRDAAALVTLHSSQKG